MQELTQIIQGATAAIRAEYFTFPIHGSDPVYRERVYCYELYHQMRLRWPEACPLFLNGEVDKQKHPYFGDGNYPKPDFLVHVPGHGENHAVIEVKSGDPKKADIRKDIETLLRFQSIGYARAIYLIYAMQVDEARERVLDCGVAPEALAAVELWVHPHPFAPAQKVEWA
jgi:hypothetical protein